MIHIKEKLFYPAVLLIVFLLAYGYIPSFKNAVVSVAGSVNGAVFAQPDGKGKGKQKKAVTFVLDAHLLEADEESKKIKVTGRGGSQTARNFAYGEMEFDLEGAVLQELGGGKISFEEVSQAKSLIIHGVDNKDGTFKVKKVQVDDLK